MCLLALGLSDLVFAVPPTTTQYRPPVDPPTRSTPGSFNRIQNETTIVTYTTKQPVTDGSFTRPTTASTPFPPKCVQDGWSEWMNIDTPQYQTINEVNGKFVSREPQYTHDLWDGIQKLL